MKKLILVMAVITISVFTVKAQDKSGGTKVSIAANVGIPTSSGISFTEGGDLQAEFGKITLSAGYQNYSFKSGGGNSYMIPVLAGLEFPFTDKVYGHAQLGYGFGEGSNSGAFGYAPSIGTSLGSKWDASVKYLGFSKSGSNLGSINLRLAYSF